MKLLNAARRTWFSILLLSACMAVIGSPDCRVAAGPPTAPDNSNDPILKWNNIGMQAMADDHSGTFGPATQGGPTRASRAFAIVHIAMYDAANAIVGGYEPYITVTGLPPGTIESASLDAAVAQAAHDTLAVLYPSQASVFNRELQRALNGVPRNRGRYEGILVGAMAADNILMARENDGGDDPNVPFAGDPDCPIGVHQPDPLNPGQGLLTPNWGAVVPFAMDDVTNFHAPPPPQPNSPNILERMEYAYYYDEVQTLGGDGINTPTDRTAEQTEIGIFWGYDGAVNLGPPPRLYNQIARMIAQQERNTVIENARLFALINISMADAGIAAWYTKYEYDYWRPIIGIRCGADDDNEFTVGDQDWMPLGAPATNGTNGGVDFTPPFPAYTSGHATFGAALFRTLANMYGDDYSFQVRSDEMWGPSVDSQGRHRPARIRRFTSFSQAARENADSRIYLGVHWGFDANEGIKIGNDVADCTFNNFLRPL